MRWSQTRINRIVAEAAAAESVPYALDFRVSCPRRRTVTLRPHRGPPSQCRRSSESNLSDSRQSDPQAKFSELTFARIESCFRFVLTSFIQSHSWCCRKLSMLVVFENFR